MTVLQSIDTSDSVPFASISVQMTVLTLVRKRHHASSWSSSPRESRKAFPTVTGLSITTFFLMIDVLFGLGIGRRSC